MGVDTAGAQLLFAAKALGVDFSETVTIGRQFLSVDPAALAAMFRAHRIDADAHVFLRNAAGWAEGLLELLGARTVESMDASGFEGATLIHDLNTPIDASLHGRFGVVYDGGTLEHVFNMPQALSNCMEMVRKGGWFIQQAPANNFMGHGFYQFSPELMYRVFSPDNGFTIVAVLLHESVPGGRWYAVADPAVVGKRVQMTNRLPMDICTIARRDLRLPLFRHPPQQSDYEAGWQNRQGMSGGVYRRERGWRSRLARNVLNYLPTRIERTVRTMYSPSLEAQHDCYRRIDAERLIRGHV